jgi:hypothetical protein
VTPVSRDTKAGQVYLDLQKQARAAGANTDQLLIRYVLERFLYRITQTPWQGRLILKGGMLLAAFDVRRTTQDVDMAARAVEADGAEVAGWLRDVVAVEVDDGVRFDLSELRTEPIREGEPYPGLRVHATAYVATAKVPLKIDVNFGDPIVPEPVAVSYPSLLDDPFPILGYPLTAVLGEKIETMVRRGAANTRDRDFADVALLSRLHAVDGDELLSSLQATAKHRGTELAPFTEALGTLIENRQRAWGPIRRRLGLENELSADFADVVAEVTQFAEPLLTGEAARRTWNPNTRSWA